MKVITVDFETHAIAPRPYYPPDPVGVAIKWPGRVGKYFAFGHPTENTHSEDEAIAALAEAYDSDFDLVFHNAKFDVAVANERWGFPIPPWQRVHDTMFLLFLDDPYSPSLALKPSAQRYLGMAPDERDAVRDWLIAHKDFVREQTGELVTEKNFSKFIAYAPGKLVGKYAVGDVDRTEKLFNLLYKKIKDRGMGGSYDTERELMPILLINEQEGMRVDLKALSADLKMYEGMLLRADDWIYKKLGIPGGFNIDSGDQLADALEGAGVVTEFDLTATGKRSTAKDTLTIDRFHDIKVYRMLTYRSKLAYSLSTFMRPWFNTASLTKGTIHTNWNQVMRQGAGAITGRLSSSPNFQNITKNIEEKANAYQHPSFAKWAPELPSLRHYILPDRGQKFGHRDFSQQELRILAHFEDADLRRAYEADANLDVHTLVQGLLADAGKPLERPAVKGFNFGILYGMGATGLSRRLGVTMSEARELIRTWNAVMPGVAQLVEDIKQTVREGEFIRTWGGRQYGMPPPNTMYGEPRDRDYVLLNYLIQGSGADATKRALIEFHKAKRESRILVNVHDEINFSCPAGAMKQEQAILRKCIEGLEFDVPMLSDGKAGPNWGDTKKFKD